MSHVSIPVGVRLDLADGWFDITDTLDAGSPFTLARDDGVGAFQFSSALYKGGIVPTADCEDLTQMLHAFFANRNLGEAVDVVVHSSHPSFVAGSSRKDGLIRVWYVSNARSFVLATYTSDFDASTEVYQCEAMVRSIQFEE